MNLLARFRYSLSARLLAIFVAAGLAFGLVVSIGVGVAFSTFYQRNLDPILAHYLSYLQADIGNPPDLGRAADIAARIPAQVHLLGPNLRWSSSGQVLDPDAIRFEHGHRRFSSWMAELGFSVGHLHEAFVLISDRRDYRLYFVFEGRFEQGRSMAHRTTLLAAVLCLLAVVFLVTRRLFRPISDIGAGVRRIGTGDFSHRIKSVRNDELGELAQSVNTMAADIGEMLEAKRQLLLAVSHELRSPLTRARVNLALLEGSPPAMEIERDIKEIDAMISELLESERLNSRHAPLNRCRMDVNELVRVIITEQFAGKAVNATYLDEPLREFDLDPARVRLLIRNLLDNALRHNREEQGPVGLALSIAGKVLTIAVSDHGAGIEPEQIRRLTEPFYRVDSSRQRKTGGYGLGLYLAKTIAAAHGGELTVGSVVGRGTEVTATLLRPIDEN